jgi:non-specific serine/threonine protein kinase
MRLADCLGIPAAERPAFMRFARGDVRAETPRSPLAAAAPWQPAWQPTRRDQLPAPVTSLIGRAPAAVAVRRHLLSSDTRFVSLVGPAGVGKTRLALFVAAGLAEEHAFLDGVFFVPLATIRDPGLVVPAIAETLDVIESDGLPPAEQLSDLLQSRRVLLVLDNLEQVTEAAAPLVDLLRTCPGLSLLVTTRIPLRAYGERLFPVPPLTLPNPGNLPEPGPLAGYSAVALFVARAQAVEPEFALTADNAAAVAAICSCLDGLPLAIELIAAKVGWMPPQALLPIVSGRFALAVQGPQGLPERHQTLQNAIDWSFDLLAPAEQVLLARLAVFSGGCSLAAAEAVAGATTADVGALLLSGLLHDSAGGDAESRLAMLETIHQYAQAKLDNSGEAGQVRRRHGLYFLELVETAEPHLVGRDQLGWLHRLEQEHDNLRAALAWAVDAGQAETAIRLCAAVWRLWHIHGHLSEGRRWLAQALAVPGECPAGYRARALNAAGALAGSQRNFEAAAGFFEASLALRRELGDVAGVISSLNNLGLVARNQGDFERAYALHRENLALAQAAGRQPEIARALHSLGLVASAQGEYSLAQDYFRQSLALAQVLGDQYAIGSTLHALGQAALGLRRLTEGARYFEASLTIGRELGDIAGIAGILLGLAAVAGLENKAVAAARLLGAAESLFDSIRSPILAVNQAVYEQARQAVSERLSGAALAHALAEGRALAASHWEEAADYALQALR